MVYWTAGETTHTTEAKKISDGTCRQVHLKACRQRKMTYRTPSKDSGIAENFLFNISSNYKLEVLACYMPHPWNGVVKDVIIRRILQMVHVHYLKTTTTGKVLVQWEAIHREHTEKHTKIRHVKQVHTPSNSRGPLIQKSPDITPFSFSIFFFS